jgi:RHS repeat-associated protein
MKPLRIMGAIVFMFMASFSQAKNTLLIVVNDHLGTPQMLVDKNNHVVWQAEYDEFGKADILIEEVEFNMRLPGQYYDKETSLHYNYYRDYDPSLGRYVQSDPIGLRGGINTYAYVYNNPIRHTDPLGLLPPQDNPGYNQIFNNIQTAEGIYDPRTFKELVQNGGNWDYKQQTKHQVPRTQNYEAFGNYNYGLTGAATSLFSLETLLREAGQAQCQAGTSSSAFGTPKSGFPYGDDYNDQYWIMQGYLDYTMGLYGNPKDSVTIITTISDWYSSKKASNSCGNSCSVWGVR